MPRQFVVIGAGVLGLSTAIELQTKYPTTSVIIVSAELPYQMSFDTIHPHATTADYASSWAGAHYRPIPATTPQLKQEQWLAMVTFERMKDIARTAPEAGVKLLPGVELLESPDEGYLSLKTGDTYAGGGDDFRVLTKDHLPSVIQWGCTYNTYCLNVVTYCQWLIAKFIANGGHVIQRTLSHPSNAFDLTKHHKKTIVVNCSGRNFDLDPKVKITRGQTVLVKNVYDKTITRQNSDGSWSFLIPRPGAGTIVGGTKEIGDWESQPRSSTTKTLLQKAVEAFPDFIDRVEDFQIIKENVGRRPWRESGMRIEVEELGDGQRIVHGYGAGGRGFEISWGVAKELVELISELVGDDLESKL